MSKYVNNVVDTEKKPPAKKKANAKTKTTSKKKDEK
jgi:hypothetical protein